MDLKNILQSPWLRSPDELLAGAAKISAFLEELRAMQAEIGVTTEATLVAHLKTLQNTSESWTMPCHLPSSQSALAEIVKARGPVPGGVKF